MTNHYETGKLVFDFEDIENCVNLSINTGESIHENLIDTYTQYCENRNKLFNQDECNYAMQSAVEDIEYGDGVYLRLNNDKFNPKELFGNASEESLYEAVLKNNFLKENDSDFSDYEYIVRANLSTDKCGTNIKVKDFGAFDTYGDFSKFSADGTVVIPFDAFEAVSPNESYDACFDKDSKSSIDTFQYPTENKDVSDNISLICYECDVVRDFVNSKGGELDFDKTKDNIDVGIVDFGYGSQIQVFIDNASPFETFTKGMVEVRENFSDNKSLFHEIANEFNDRIGKDLDGREPVLQLAGGVPVIESNFDISESDVEKTI
jgi:hypothetical protein